MCPRFAAAAYCYKENIRPKLISLALALPDEVAADDGKKGGGKKGGGGGKKGGKKEEKIPAKTQIKIDNVMRIMNGGAAKDKGPSKLQVRGAPRDGAVVDRWQRAAEAVHDLGCLH